MKARSDENRIGLFYCGLLSQAYAARFPLSHRPVTANYLQPRTVLSTRINSKARRTARAGEQARKVRGRLRCFIDGGNLLGACRNHIPIISIAWLLSSEPWSFSSNQVYSERGADNVIQSACKNPNDFEHCWPLGSFFGPDSIIRDPTCPLVCRRLHTFHRPTSLAAGNAVAAQGKGEHRNVGMKPRLDLCPSHFSLYCRKSPARRRRLTS